ncbi:hypothetical protein KQI84_09915 [bacterium]|nr:hypothetical protein [bacterium]
MPPACPRRFWRKYVLALLLSLFLLSLAVSVYEIRSDYKRRQAIIKSCIQNQNAIYSSVLQFMEQEGIEDLDTAMEILGTEQSQWSEKLVGPGKFMRYNPRCPMGPSHGESDFSLRIEDGHLVVICNPGIESHRMKAFAGS